MITFSHVDFSYESSLILKDVSFTVNEGEFVSFVGPNGSGKTTAINLILGLLSPSKGTIEKTVTTDKIGYVPQSVNLDPSFPITVLEVVLTGVLSTMTWWGGYLPGDKKRGMDALARIGMETYAKQSFGTLSGGQRQRVLIARALIADPKLLIMDEPTSNIDQATEAVILDLLSSCKQTIVLVTHDFENAVQRTNRVLYFQQKVTSLDPKSLCKHFGMGLYHPISRGDNE